MPPAPRRTSIGYRRRVPLNHATPKSRTRHLNGLEVGYRQALQTCILGHEDAARQSFRSIRQLLRLKATAHNTNPDPDLDCTVDLLLQAESSKFHCYVRFLAHWIEVDHNEFDMSPLEERVLPIRPWLDVRFSDWSNDRCRDCTGFRKNQLIRIYKAFGLRELCRQHDEPHIGLCTGFSNPSGSDCRYLFHPEELFLFFMTKCRTGDSNKKMVNDKFGGELNRWSYGFPWMVFYVDNRYKDVIGHQHLLKYLKDFPRFHEAIEQFATKRKYHRNVGGGGGWMSPGLAHLPWWLFGLVDCNIKSGDVTHSGPDGDYEGAARRPDHELYDRATYTGFTQVHGLKTETAHLPNGIITVFGPASCRRHDTGGLLRMSNLDAFLSAIQEDEPVQYSLFGDFVYGAFWLHNFVTYFRSFAGEPLTLYEFIVNAEMKNVRQTVEWPFADRDALFGICTEKSCYWLGKYCPFAIELLRVCYLLTNIYTCLNGNKSTSYKRFGLSPPILEEYLRLN